MNDNRSRSALAVLAVITAGLTLQQIVFLETPLPQEGTPSNPQIVGYRLEQISERTGSRSRNFSHNTIRQWRMIPDTGEPALILSLVSVRARKPHDFQMASFLRIDSDFSLQQRRLHNDPAKGPSTANAEEYAFGRGKNDRPGTTTRLQSCITPGGSAGVTSRFLTTQLNQQQRSKFRQDPMLSILNRVIGLSPHKSWECIAVQISTLAAKNNEQRLKRTWTSVADALTPLSPIP